MTTNNLEPGTLAAGVDREERLRHALNEARDLAKTGDLDAVSCAAHLAAGRFSDAFESADAAAEAFDAIEDRERAESARWLVDEIDSLTE
uniref:Uncharacterized protein n=1 Tax=viral metagenome TaxID=1070528 RepID=A0A6H1ZBG3_9ZZZZ